MSGVSDVVSGAGTVSSAVIAGVGHGANQLLSAGETYLNLTHGELHAHDDVNPELFADDRLHPNAMGHRMWASCLENELSNWAVS